MSLNILSYLPLSQFASNIDRTDGAKQVPNIKNSSINKGDSDRFNL
jgi:hypothetical protein